MIEILVCLLVMSIVVICSAGLSLQSSRLSRHSAQFSAAAMLAGELADRLRLRLSRQAPPASSTAASAGMPALSLDSLDAVDPSRLVDCYAANCSADQMEQFEWQDWRRRVAAILPDARVVACRDSESWNESAGRHEWRCPAVATGTAPLVIKLGWVTPMSAAGGVAAPLLVVPVE